jgi:hypothetical protein
LALPPEWTGMRFACTHKVSNDDNSLLFWAEAHLSAFVCG